MVLAGEINLGCLDGIRGGGGGGSGRRGGSGWEVTGRGREPRMRGGHGQKPLCHGPVLPLATMGSRPGPGCQQ